MLWIVRGDSTSFYCVGFEEVMQAWAHLRGAREHASIIPVPSC